MIRALINTLKDNKGFILFIVLMSIFRSSFADWNEVPTGSMNPTIIEGDRLLVNKLAYDIRLPFVKHSIMEVSHPLRGDIIVFESKVSKKRLVKRVVGLPGDLVEMRDNILFINNEKIAYDALEKTSLTSKKIEYLLGIAHLIKVNNAGSSRSNFPALKVPQNYYLALGDNRDNSADSRVIGFIPREEIIGRAKRVVLSLNYDNYHIPRAERFFHVL